MNKSWTLNKTSRCVIWIGLALLITPVLWANGSNDPSPLESLSWMSGNWAGEKDGCRIEESWSNPNGGTMTGVGRTIKEGKTVFTEYMIISLEGDSPVMTIYPGLQAGVPFKLVKSGKMEAVFENKQHDFPQRLVYKRIPAEIEKLVAHLEGVVDGKSVVEDYVFEHTDSLRSSNLAL